VPLFGSLPHQEKSAGLEDAEAGGEGEPHIGLVHVPVILRHHLHHAKQGSDQAQRQKATESAAGTESSASQGKQGRRVGH
jgi:hypothetical protein